MSDLLGSVNLLKIRTINIRMRKAKPKLVMVAKRGNALRRVAAWLQIEVPKVDIGKEYPDLICTFDSGIPHVGLLGTTNDFRRFFTAVSEGFITPTFI